LFASEECKPNNRGKSKNAEQVHPAVKKEKIKEGITKVITPNKDTASLKDGDYKIMIITTYLVDSLNSNAPMWFYPLFLDQNIQLFYKDKIVYLGPHKVKKISVWTANHDSLVILENAIVEVGIIDGDKNRFFSIEGYGGCNSCPEYREILNNKGESLFLTYHDLNKTFMQRGVLMDVLRLNGIDQQKYRKGEFLKKRIEPL